MKKKSIEYYKIIPAQSKGTYGIGKFSDFVQPDNRPYAFLKNIIEIVWYDIDNEGNPIHLVARHNYSEPTADVIESLHIKEYKKSNEREFKEICKELASEKIVDIIKFPDGPYEISNDSTNTYVRFVPKKGFELGFHKMYRLEWFDSLGASYPMPVNVPFINPDIVIKVNKNKYGKGWKFIDSESTTEKSVYRRVWTYKKTPVDKAWCVEMKQ